jgi:ribosomal protein L7Ae-like RNA K-turn-binding protein
MTRVTQFLGLASRARKLVTGEELVIKGIQNRQVELVIISQDASENALKKITDKCRTYNVPCIQFGDRDLLGQAIGKGPRVVIGVTDSGFSARLQQLISK